jgi:antitoxin component of MazEF toxin-antitoxin module
MQLDFGLRKVQQVHGTHFVSLPLTWIKSYHVEKGDQIRFALVENGVLLISLERKVMPNDER